MTRLIDADELKEHVITVAHIHYGERDYVDQPIISLGWVLVAPTVDAVPVVRCKDCKFNPKKIVLGCPMAGSMSRNDESFCSVGKRWKTHDRD